MVRSILGAVATVLCIVALCLLIRGNRTEKIVKVQIACCLVACALDIINGQFFSVSFGDYITSIFTATLSFMVAVLYYRQLKSGLY